MYIFLFFIYYLYIPGIRTCIFGGTIVQPSTAQIRENLHGLLKPNKANQVWSHSRKVTQKTTKQSRLLSHTLDLWKGDYLMILSWNQQNAKTSLMSQAALSHLSTHPRCSEFSHSNPLIPVYHSNGLSGERATRTLLCWMLEALT